MHRHVHLYRLPIYRDLHFPRRMTTISKCFAGLISCNTRQPKLDESVLMFRAY